MIKKTMKVRENTFRKLEDPFENGAAKKYVFYVKVDDVAEGIPMATNPRDQKLTSGVATAIKESLLSNDGYFHLKNRGIVLSAESVHYNNKEKIATIIFSDELSHGNIDGGHTYKIVCEHKGENLEQYVQFEVMTGVEDIIENLAEARNTSVLKPSDVLHIPGLGFDGLVGYSPIAMAKNAIGMAIACEEYGAKFFANGATPGGILEDPGTVKDPQRGRDSWTSAFGGSSNFNKVAVLEEGMKYTPISISPEQAQFLETRKFQINEIARSKQKSGWLHGRS